MDEKYISKYTGQQIDNLLDKVSLWLKGGDSENGATFYPHVTEDGTLSWENDKNLANPPEVIIMGPVGPAGPAGPVGKEGPAGPTGPMGPSGELPIVTLGIMLASGWTDDGVYSFEADYPSDQYNIEIQPSEDCTIEQYEAWGYAMMLGNSSENTVKALGDVPLVDIPVIIKAVMK